MATMTRPVRGSWPTALSLGVALGWFAVLALAMWLGSNASRPIAAWFVAYPMFALYPGVAAVVAARARSPGVVIGNATLIPMAGLWLAFLPSAVQETPFGLRDDRWLYGVYTLINGLGLLVAIKTGARLMRNADRTIAGFVAAGTIFVGAAAVAFALLSVTAY